MARLCSPQDYLFFSWDVQLRTFAATCCYKRLNVIERVVTHARLACFLFETNQHLVGSARSAGLCLTVDVTTVTGNLKALGNLTLSTARAYSQEPDIAYKREHLARTVKCLHSISIN